MIARISAGIVAAGLALAACVPVDASGPACDAVGGQPMLVAHLFFGRDIAGGRMVTDADWDSFAAQILTPYFPEGLTVLDARGQYLDTTSGQRVAEPSKVAVIAVMDSAAARSRIQETRRIYAERFSQTSVGLLLSEACGAF